MKKFMSILAGYLNLDRSYLIITVRWGKMTFKVEFSLGSLFMNLDERQNPCNLWLMRPSQYGTYMSNLRKVYVSRLTHTHTRCLQSRASTARWHDTRWFRIFKYVQKVNLSWNQTCADVLIWFKQCSAQEPLFIKIMWLMILGWLVDKFTTT